MIYGLYLSATGVITTSHQQDVIANNLANAETSGFKRNLALQQQRQVESQVLRTAGVRNPLLDSIGGGQLLAPTYTDFTQGSLESSSSNFDTAVIGSGFIGVRDANNEMRLTRNGAMMLDRNGKLITAQGHSVVDTDKNPIRIQGYQQSQLSIGKDGTISAGQLVLNKIGLFDATDPQALKPVGQNLIKLTGDQASLVPAKGSLQAFVTERANVDPTTELTRLMETQRLLEANANMIKYQDQTLGKLVSEVGKIS